MTSALHVNNFFRIACLSALAATTVSCARIEKAAPAPRFADGLLRLDRAPGEKGYWDMPTAVSLVGIAVTCAGVVLVSRGR